MNSWLPTSRTSGTPTCCSTNIGPVHCPRSWRMWRGAEFIRSAGTGAGSTLPWRTPWRRASSWPKSWGRTEVCGIYGIAGFGGSGGSRLDERSLPTLLAAMGEALVHRGPDDDGVWLSQSLQVSVGIGMRRLSIIDVAG